MHSVGGEVVGFSFLPPSIPDLLLRRMGTTGENGGSSCFMALTLTRRFAVLERDGFTCQYCGARPPAVVIEVDHVHPVSKGGTDDQDNLVTACYECNHGKRDQELYGRLTTLLRWEALEEVAMIVGYIKILGAPAVLGCFRELTDGSTVAFIEEMTKQVAAQKRSCA